MPAVTRAVISATFLFFCLILATTELVVASEGHVVAVDACDDYSAALADDGTVWVWGMTDFTSKPLSLVPKASLPYQVPFVDHAKAISAGPRHVLVLKDDGTVWGWGINDAGVLGDGGYDQRNSLAQVKGLANVTAIAAGGRHNLALEENGTVWAWGDGYGGVPDKVTVPQAVAIDAGYDFSAILADDGSVWTWGKGEDGELGTGSLNNSAVPVRALVSDINAISAGSDHMLALKNDGTVWGWGENIWGQLGNESNLSQPTPVLVNDLKDATAIATGYQASYAIRKDGIVCAWGSSSSGMLGDGYYSSGHTYYPVSVVGLHDVKAIAAGQSHALALAADGSVWAWGSGGHGQLSAGFGNNYSYVDRLVPAQVSIGSRSELLSIAATPHPIGAMPCPTPTSAPVLKLQSATAPITQWTASTGEPVQYIAPVPGDQLYTFYRNNISLFKAGERLWSIEIPARWNITSEWQRDVVTGSDTGMFMLTGAKPLFDYANGFLYIYAIPANPYKYNTYGENELKNATASLTGYNLLAIAPNGTLAWELALNTTAFYEEDTSVRAAGDRIYVFHCYNETVVDQSGQVLFTIPNVAAPAGVDEAGDLYTVTASSRDWHADSVDTNGRVTGSADYRIPGSTLQSYYPNGTLRWSIDAGEAIARPFIADEIASRYGTLPVYENETLYVPVRQGVIAFDTAGNRLWSKRLSGDNYDLFELMPVDSRGNVYLRAENTTGNPWDSRIIVISPDGKTASSPRPYRWDYSTVTRTSAKDGILYDCQIVPSRSQGENYTLNDLDTAIVSAFDLINNSTLWSYQMPLYPRYSGLVDDSLLFGTIMPAGLKNTWIGKGLMGETSSEYGYSPAAIVPITFVETYPSGDRVYVNFRTAVIEYPVVLNKSRSTYSGGIYCIDRQGHLLGGQAGLSAGAMAVNNSTVYFSTGDGKITSAAIGIASGLALLGLGALALKFLFAGTIARARIRLDKNENRLHVLKYVTDHPGLTSYELARGLQMNHGTLRYHLFILGNNHRVAVFKDDNRYVRYFPNAGRYSREEQMILSLLRRESAGRVLGLIHRKPGITNAEISRELGLPDSLSSRYLKELLEKGVVIKPTQGSSYTVPDRYMPAIARMAELL